MSRELPVCITKKKRERKHQTRGGGGGRQLWRKSNLGQGKNITEVRWRKGKNNQKKKKKKENLRMVVEDHFTPTIRGAGKRCGIVWGRRKSEGEKLWTEDPNLSFQEKDEDD